MTNLQGLRNREMKVVSNGQVLTWRAKTERAWDNRENPNLEDWEEWVCVGTREED